MSVFIDPVRLLQGLARAVKSKILPSLPAGSSARFNAVAVYELLIYEWHRRTEQVPVPKKAQARAMASTDQATDDNNGGARARAGTDCHP
jgi:hypothetical protein